MSKVYVLNKETSKIELRFTKEEYKALSMEEQKMLKRAYLFSRSQGAWVSRSKNNHYAALEVAKKLGFVNGGEIGERLSFAEEVERQVERAEARQERYEVRAVKAEEKAQTLQREWNEASKDWSYVTQPIIRGHKGSESFARQRQRVLDRYAKGFEEYRKSEYFRDKADMAEMTASKSQFSNRTYLSNRIEECHKNIRAYNRILEKLDENSDRSNHYVEKLEYEVDKLAYLTNKLDELGNHISKENLKVGYEILIRNSWYKVVKLNAKTVEAKPSVVPYTLKYHYAEILDFRIPSEWKDEVKPTMTNPIQIDDIFTYTAVDGIRIIKAFQVIKTTDRSVTLQEIKVVDNVPQLNQFTLDKSFRRNIKLFSNNRVAVNYDNWYLYKFVS